MSVNTSSLCLCFYLATIVTAQAASAQCHDDFITLKNRKNQDGSVSITASTRHASELSVKLNFENITNMKSSIPLPHTFQLVGHKTEYELLRCTPVAKGKYSVNYRYKFARGFKSDKPTVDYVYRLPYPTGLHFRCAQSYTGKTGHQKGTVDEYAVDFDMPENSQILAARDGTVISCRSDSNSGGNDKKFDDCANYVLIKHNDGTYAAYVHLCPGGVDVKVGQRVAVGERIGKAGRTGWASGPHLHFMVYRITDTPEMQSIPFRMRAANSIYTKLEVGKYY